MDEERAKERGLGRRYGWMQETVKANVNGVVVGRGQSSPTGEKAVLDFISLMILVLQFQELTPEDTGAG